MRTTTAAKPYFLFLLSLSFSVFSYGQADNEIQVYASPITPKNLTLFELHQNYTFNGQRSLADKRSARWLEETLEITHGFGKNFELGFYTFTGVSPYGGLQFLGNHIRPRYTFPQSWHLPFGASVSLELGYIRPNVHSDFIVDGELRPIMDKSFGPFYISFNPNVGFALTGPDKYFGIGPQLKTVYTVAGRFGLGIEYYSEWGTFRRIDPIQQQEHLLGPMFDLYTNPKWELQTGLLFGLTEGSNRQVFKLILGRRVS